jgi:hypothetical protein
LTGSYSTLQLSWSCWSWWTFSSASYQSNFQTFLRTETKTNTVNSAKLFSSSRTLFSCGEKNLNRKTNL